MLPFEEKIFTDKVVNTTSKIVNNATGIIMVIAFFVAMIGASIIFIKMAKQLSKCLFG